MIIEQKIVSKPWGYEIIWAQCEKFVGKVIYINKGHKLSRQYHKFKEESIFVQKGNLLVEIGSRQYKKKFYLDHGQSFHITPNTIHRFCAWKDDVMLFEVSTSELKDVVRLEDDYNR